MEHYMWQTWFVNRLFIVPTQEPVANQLPDWIRGKLDELDLTQNELGEKAHLSRSQMSRLVNGQRPSPEVARRLAQALNTPPDTILQLAGQLPPRPERNPRIDELVMLFLQMDNDGQEEELATLRLRVERRKRGRNAKPSGAQS